MWSHLTSVLTSTTTRSLLISQTSLNLTVTREAHSFFSSRQAKQLWKSVTSVSNQGRIKGRGRGLLRIKNLNQGQKLGFGKAKVNFAGLTSTLRLDEKQSGPTPVVKKLDEDEYSKYLDGIDEKKKKFTVTKQGRRRVTPLERGWTSATMQGKRFGPPEDKSTDATYDNFDSILIETKMLSPMTSLFGRTRVLRLLMITGNGNGLLGYTLSKSRWGQIGRAHV